MSLPHMPFPELAGQTPPRKRFTVAEVERMLDLGLFEGERYELIDGDLLVKHGRSPRHAYSVQQGIAALIKNYPAERILCQMPFKSLVRTLSTGK